MNGSREAKQKRRELLAQIDILEKQRCTVCEGFTANTQEINCQCAAAVEIRKLGVEYESIAKESRSKQVGMLINAAVENGLTVDLYRQLREHNLNDIEIRRFCNVGYCDLENWKAGMGLTKTYQKRKAEKDVPIKSGRSKKYKEYGLDASDFETAAANNISYSAVMHRVKAGWSVERAITAPTAERKHDVKKWLPVAEANGIKVHTLRRRIERGEPIEIAATRITRKKEVAQ